MSSFSADEFNKPRRLEARRNSSVGEIILIDGDWQRSTLVKISYHNFCKSKDIVDLPSIQLYLVNRKEAT